MKSIKNNTTIFLFSLILIMAIGFSACEEDAEIVPKTLEQYKSEFSDLVSSEIEAVENCERAYGIGDFYTTEEVFDSVTSVYLDSLLVAEEVLAQVDVTIADIILANENLTIAGNVFNGKIYKSDRTSLNELIVECEGMRDTTQVGYYYSQCPPLADSIFGVAIEWASFWRGTITTLERQVTAEVDSLNRAFVIYKDAIVK
jgi:hypothetical protein